MIDWHCHILPAIDDGPETLAESLEMARILAAVGFRQVHCTPHAILGRFDNRPSQVRKATVLLQKELDATGIPLSLSPGMEYYLDEYFPVLLERPQTLGDSRMLLVEIPSQASAELVLDNIERILQRGYVPLLAHPERSALLYREGSPLKGLLQRLLVLPSGPATGDEDSIVAALWMELQDKGSLFQGNLPSLSGYYGRRVQRRAESHLEGGLYHCFGSDGHGAESLQAQLLPALQALAGYQKLQDTGYKAQGER